MEKSPKAFISYSHKDRNTAIDLAEALRSHDIPSFMDTDLMSDDNWEDIIKEELKSSSVFVMILSKNSIDSPWRMQELGAAIARGISIIPILIDDTKIPFNIRKYKYFDFSKNDSKTAMNTIIQDVKI